MILGLLIGAVAVAAVLVFSYERTIRILQGINHPNTIPVTPLELLRNETVEEDGYPQEPMIDAEAFKAMFMNEDEEDVKHLLESGRITEEQIPDVLDALGVVHEVNFS